MKKTITSILIAVIFLLAVPLISAACEMIEGNEWVDVEWTNNSFGYVIDYQGYGINSVRAYYTDPVSGYWMDEKWFGFSEGKHNITLHLNRTVWLRVEIFVNGDYFQSIPLPNQAYFFDKVTIGNVSASPYMICEEAVYNNTDPDVNDTEPDQNDTEPEVCISEWDCSKWTDCEKHEKIRTCIDINNCTNATDIPLMSKECGYGGGGGDEDEDEIEEEPVIEPEPIVEPEPVINDTKNDTVIIVPEPEPEKGIIEKIIDYLLNLWRGIWGRK